MHVCSGVGCVQLVVGLAAVLVAGGPAVAAKPGEDREAMADRRAVAERLRHEAAAVAHGAAYDPVNLARLGVAQAQVGHEAGALTTFDTILPADHRKIPEFIAELVVLRVRAGDTEGALRLVDGVRWAHWDRSQGFVQLAVVQAVGRRNPTVAARAASRARELAAARRDPASQCAALGVVGEVLVAAGLTDPAVDVRLDLEVRTARRSTLAPVGSDYTRANILLGPREDVHLHRANRTPGCERNCHGCLSSGPAGFFGPIHGGHFFPSFAALSIRSGAGNSRVPRDLTPPEPEV